MKDYFKVTLMTLIGLICAVFLYPCLHEGGHVAASLLFGGKYVEANLLPQPYMICDAAGVGLPQLIAIGLSGIFLPFLVSFALRSKNFYIWFTRLILRGITALSFFISIFAAVLQRFGITMQENDVVKILNLWTGGTYWVVAGCLILCISIVVLIVKDKPMHKIMMQLT